MARRSRDQAENGQLTPRDESGDVHKQITERGKVDWPGNPPPRQLPPLTYSLPFPSSLTLNVSFFFPFSIFLPFIYPSSFPSCLPSISISYVSFFPFCLPSPHLPRFLSLHCFSPFPSSVCHSPFPSPVPLISPPMSSLFSSSSGPLPSPTSFL